MKLVINIDDKTYKMIKDGLFLIKGGRGSGRIMEYNALKAIYDGKPLEQEPCEDCVSRQAVLDKAVYTETEEGWSGMTVDVKDIEALPPVTPKTGHWEQYGNSWEDKFKCSECGKEQPKILCGERIIGHWSDYCPNCGAKIESEEE